jgi:DNA-binding NtrC family response regulator
VVLSFVSPRDAAADDAPASEPAGAERFTCSLGVAQAPFGRLVIERRTGGSLSRHETETVEAAARALALALDTQFERTDHSTLAEEIPQEVGRFEFLVGSSRPMMEIYRLIEQVATSDSSVLILGESGTGKELVARSIHVRSPRMDEPFVAISCPSIPRDLIESELFGYERGAFTGAVATRPGKIELAERGTLFLDEVGDMPLPTQAKILRFLEEREFQRVGGRESRRVDVRLISATSRDLTLAMHRGEFREDLYYRLNVVPISMPRLRDRIEDIPLLVDHFLRLLPPGKSGRPRRVSAAALDRLLSHQWPGNVRELRNVMEYMITLAEGDVLESRHLPVEVRQRERLAAGASPKDSAAPEIATVSDKEAGIRPGETLESRLIAVEATLIRSTLEATNWNQSAAARRLGITESKIRKRMKQYGIQRPDEI